MRGVWQRRREYGQAQLPPDAAFFSGKTKQAPRLAALISSSPVEVSAATRLQGFVLPPAATSVSQ